MGPALPSQMATTLAAWAAGAGILGAIVASVALVAVVLQLRRAAALSRAEATIQFQRAFSVSRDARERLLKTFPIHENVIGELAEPGAKCDFRTWKNLEDLTPNERRDADAVINALNDVAQYVVDGLSLRSALQQYHTIFIRTGVLLYPYLDARNAPLSGRPQTRYGRRVPELYNAGLEYHRHHPKHRGCEVALERPAIQSTDASLTRRFGRSVADLVRRCLGYRPRLRKYRRGEVAVASRTLQTPRTVRLVLLKENGLGTKAHPGFADESTSLGGTRSLRRAVRAAEQKLRR